MPKFCPECNTQTYDDTSFFCYNCGTRLPAFMMGRRRDVSRISSRIVPRKNSTTDRFDTSPSIKSTLYLTIESIEICASCGVPIDDKTRIFCEDCWADIRECLTGKKSTESIRNLISLYLDVTKDSVQGPGVGISGVSQNPVIMSIPAQEPAPVNPIPVQGSNNTTPKGKEWTLIFIFGGIALLYLLLMLVLVLMF
jgi:hypothetical protein